MSRQSTYARQQSMGGHSTYSRQTSMGRQQSFFSHQISSFSNSSTFKAVMARDNKVFKDMIPRLKIVTN